jgi:hypothetical protein
MINFYFIITERHSSKSELFLHARDFHHHWVFLHNVVILRCLFDGSGHPLPLLSRGFRKKWWNSWTVLKLFFFALRDQGFIYPLSRPYSMSKHLRQVVGVMQKFNDDQSQPLRPIHHRNRWVGSDLPPYHKYLQWNKGLNKAISIDFETNSWLPGQSQMVSTQTFSHNQIIRYSREILQSFEK